MKLALIIVLLGIVVFCTWRGYKNGIIRGVCGILAIILALYGAGILAGMYSAEFDGILTPFVSGMIDSAADKIQDFDEKTYDPEKSDEKPPKVILSKDEKKDVACVSYAVSRQLGLIDTAAELVADEVAEECKTVNQNMYETLSAKLCARLSYVAVFCVAFAMIAIIFAVIGNVINISFLIPTLGLIEPTVGAILGLIKGIMLMYAVAMFLRYLGLIIPDSALMEGHLIYRLVNDNPVAVRVGL